MGRCTERQFQINKSFKSAQLRRQACEGLPINLSPDAARHRKPRSVPQLNYPHRVFRHKLCNAVCLFEKTDNSQWLFSLRSLWELRWFPPPLHTMLPCNSLSLSAEKRKEETASQAEAREKGCKTDNGCQKTVSVQTQQGRKTARRRGRECHPVPFPPAISRRVSGKFKERFMYLCT